MEVIGCLDAVHLGVASEVISAMLFMRHCVGFGSLGGG